MGGWGGGSAFSQLICLRALIKGNVINLKGVKLNHAHLISGVSCGVNPNRQTKCPGLCSNTLSLTFGTCIFFSLPKLPFSMNDEINEIRSVPFWIALDFKRLLHQRRKGRKVLIKRQTHSFRKF